MQYEFTYSGRAYKSPIGLGLPELALHNEVRLTETSGVLDALEGSTEAFNVASGTPSVRPRPSDSSTWPGTT